MDFDLSDEQREIQRLVRDFAQGEVKPVAEELDRIPGVACPPSEGGFYAWVDVRGLEIGSERLARMSSAETSPSR